MKYIQSSLHFFFVSLDLIILTSNGGKVSDKLNSNYGRWIKNDTPRSFTYDCEGSKLWDEVHGKNIRSLEIRNCSELALSFSPFAHPIADNKRNFRYLTINDIGELWIEIQNAPGCLPSNLIIKNVDFVSSFYFPWSDKECEDLDLTLKSLVLKNVTMSVLDRNLKYQNLSRLEMEEVYMDFAERNSLKLVNKNGVVNISNSVIETAEPDFMNFNVSKVIFSGNTIQNFDESDRLISFEADEVILNGNVMKKITNGTMKIISDNVKITENTIEWMDVNIFDNIQPNSIMSNSFLNFSKNSIRFLSTNSSIDDSKIEIFANLTIADNIFSCSCHNISQVRAFRKFYLEWTKEANRNKCWNFPNCYIHQVLQHCGGLSENDYNCSVEVNEKKAEIYNIDLNIEEKVDNDSFNLMDTKFKSDISNEDIYHSNLIVFIVSLILAFIICIIGFIMGYVVRIMYVKHSPNPNFYVKTFGK